MLKALKRSVMKMFREFLVYHHSSLEFRAKLLTLMVSSNGEMDECEKQKLKEIAHHIYSDNDDRAELLIDMVKEFHNKIVTDNGLNFEDLIQQVAAEVREVKRFCQKIDIGLLMQLHACMDEEDEEERLFQIRIIEFLQNLKEECRVA
jgi:uncharacterized tellurite resistance protein B-like protein